MQMQVVSKDKHTQRRDALIAEYYDYVNSVVGYLISSMGLPIALSDEFMAAGYLGLVESADRFDFNSGYSFKNFAFLRIRGAIIDSIRECSELTGKAYRYVRALKAAQELREDEVACEELAEQGVNVSSDSSLTSVMNYLGQSALAYRLSVIDFRGLLATEGEHEASPEENYLQRETILKTRELVKRLPKRERQVIELFYFKGRSFQQIAKKFGGFSKSWVSRVHAKALKLLMEEHIRLTDPAAAAQAAAEAAAAGPVRKRRRRRKSVQG